MEPMRSSALRGDDARLLQSLQGSVTVFARVRPLLPAERKRQGHGRVAPTFPSEKTVCVMSPETRSRQLFEYDRVHPPSADNDAVFEPIRPLVASVVDGHAVSILAYGQTGSGKTYTMEGPAQNRGVNFRALDEIFYTAETRRETHLCAVSVAVVEIYNEQVYDLLAKRRKLGLRAGKDGVVVKDLSRHAVQSTRDVERILESGARKRSVGGTEVNDRSSRSHCVVTIEVTSRERGGQRADVRGKLHLVDLAGSERLSKSHSEGERLVEARAINKSLAVLGDVIGAISAKRAHVPYRNSKLTHLLQDALGGVAIVCFFVQLSPPQSNVGETLCSLKFAQRLKAMRAGSVELQKFMRVQREHKELLKQERRAKADRERQEQAAEQLQRAQAANDRKVRQRAAAVGSSGSAIPTRQSSRPPKPASAFESAPPEDGPAQISVAELARRLGVDVGAGSQQMLAEVSTILHTKDSELEEVQRQAQASSTQLQHAEQRLLLSEEFLEKISNRASELERMYEQERQKVAGMEQQQAEILRKDMLLRESDAEVQRLQDEVAEITRRSDVVHSAMLEHDETFGEDGYLIRRFDAEPPRPRSTSGAMITLRSPARQRRAAPASPNVRVTSEPREPYRSVAERAAQRAPLERVNFRQPAGRAAERPRSAAAPRPRSAAERKIAQSAHRRFFGS